MSEQQNTPAGEWMLEQTTFVSPDVAEECPAGDERAIKIADMLNRQECCQSHGGVGCHPGRCEECPRNAADELRRLHAALAKQGAGEPVATAADAAAFIERKAGDYAREFGSDDMGSLSFGNDAMREYHWGLLELAEEIRALTPPASHQD